MGDPGVFQAGKAVDDALIELKLVEFLKVRPRFVQNGNDMRFFI